METLSELHHLADNVTKNLIDLIESMCNGETVETAVGGGEQEDPHSMSPGHKCIRKDDTLRLTLDLVRAGIDSRIAEIRRERNMLIPPINGLPTELLSEIFLFSVEKPEVLRACSVKGHAGLRCDDNPSVLTEVCFHWRTVAIFTPGVWSLLCSRFRIGRIKCFLAPSKNYPLDIWCHPAHHEQFIPLILPHLSRWQTFTSWSPYILDNVDRLFQYTPAPLLTDFMLERVLESG
ncbi:hypothetical protein FRC02_005583 [Tulasnella sp. 418]|nr:hypothetical protein FRC02_005583 [Tulasnella sp. 418]